jgi:hypothetical protein
MWRDLVIGFATAVIVTWLVLILALLIVRPKGRLLSPDPPMYSVMAPDPVLMGWGC